MQHRAGGYGHPNYESLTAMVHLCLGDVTIPLPHSCGKARVLRLYAPKKLSEPE
jgi:hypothetical protein